MSNQIPGHRTRYTRVGGDNSRIVDGTIAAGRQVDADQLRKAARAITVTGRPIGASDTETAELVAMLGVGA